MSMIEKNRPRARGLLVSRSSNEVDNSRPSIHGNEAGGNALRLQYSRLMRELRELSARIGADDEDLQQFRSDLQHPFTRASKHLNTVQAMIAARRRRSTFFPRDLFADPAWDILLELYGAELEQRRTTVSCLCGASDVPATTALRWIAAMVEKKLLVRQPDKLDGRRIFVELTNATSQSMCLYFEERAIPPLEI